MQSLFTSFTLKSMLRRYKSWRFRFLLCTIAISCLLLISATNSTTQQMEYEESKNTYGSWNFSIYETSSTRLNSLRKNVLIDKMGSMTIYGTVKTDSLGTNSYIGTMDDDAKELTGLTFEDGTYPKAPDEIALEKDLLLRLGLDDTIGEPVNITYINSLGESQVLSFRLCGIVNSYHNTYLKQGPLVTAFVCNYFNSSIKLQEYLNVFIKLKDNYCSEQVMQEIKQPLSREHTNKDEKWYYNTYIKSPNDIPMRAVLEVFTICSILIVSLYHSFFSYYRCRYHKLANSQLIGLNKKKIFFIFFQESSFCIGISFIAGLVLGGIMMGLYYLIADAYYKTFVLYINYKLFLYSLGLAIFSVLIGTFAPAVHSYMLLDKKPKLNLPDPKKCKTHKKYKPLNIITVRFFKVYKKNAFCFLFLNTLTVTVLISLCVIGSHYSSNVHSIKTHARIDYTIGSSPFDKKNACKEKNYISTTLLDKIDILNEVDTVQKYRYTYINSIPLIELPIQTTYDQSTDKKVENEKQLLKALPNVNYQEENTCIIYIPEYYKFTDKNSLFQSMPCIGDTINFNCNGILTTVKITAIINHNTLNKITNNDFCNSPCIFSNTPTYNRINLSPRTNSYNYVSMIYRDDADCPATTNIIDSVLFSDRTLNLTHTAIDKKNYMQCYGNHIVGIIIFSIFILSISLTIQRSTLSSSLDYMKYQLSLFWYLGLPKKQIRKTLFTAFFLLTGFSILLAMFLAIGEVSFFDHMNYFCCLDRYSPYYIDPLSFLLTILVLLCYHLVQFSCCAKDVNKLLNKF